MKINSSLIYLVQKKKSEVTLINKYSDLMHNDIIIITTINYHLIKYLIMLINANSGQLVANNCNTLSFTVGNHPLCFSKYIPINILFKHHLHKCTVPAYFWRGTVQLQIYVILYILIKQSQNYANTACIIS